ncbi:MAG: hypothetical protein JSR56_07225 [Proteobacteria bacterium]|nr:hypothetical protein [Pseudomonadota bacterium]
MKFRSAWDLLRLRHAVGFVTISRLFAKNAAMLETNPIRARIADLRERVETLRGYL